MHFNANANSISIINVPGIFQTKTRLYVVGMVILNKLNNCLRGINDIMPPKKLRNNLFQKI